jgi:ferrochelatase
VLDLPYLIRMVLLNAFILPFRPYKSAHAYQKIWTAQGSPLLLYSQELEARLQTHFKGKMEIALGMRYGKPNIAVAIQQLKNKNCDSITILPLFPQYSSAATGSAIECALKIFAREWNIPNIRVISDFYDHPAYIEAVSTIARDPLQSFNPDMVLMSYHGLPVRQVAKSYSEAKTEEYFEQPPEAIGKENRYCYRSQCFATSRAIAERLGLSEAQYRVSFQSRLGRVPWIKPYTDEIVKDLYASGVRRLAVMCPSFTADCLETLEEINITLRAQWRDLGGEDFCYIPCVNGREDWVVQLITKNDFRRKPEPLLKTSVVGIDVFEV